MQLFSVAFVAFLALTTVQAEDMASIHLRINSNGGVADWSACTGGLKCSGLGSVCVRYSQYYAQCKPKILPQGELCGQNDGTNIWSYEHCPNGQTCQAVGTDRRCKNKSRQREDLEKDASCTITIESQCDGQNWSGSTCCADPNYECRWSDDGQNVKRCQKIAADNLYEDLDTSDSDDYSTSGADDYSELQRE